MKLEELKAGTLLRTRIEWYAAESRRNPGDIILFLEIDKLWHNVGGEWHFFALCPDGTKRSFGGPAGTRPGTYFEIAKV